jgi:transposase
MNAFRGMLGTRVIQCRPRDPEAKGLVERANGYLETSFLRAAVSLARWTSTPSSATG